MDEVLFARCAVANHLINTGNEAAARDKVIQLLDFCRTQNLEPPPVVNALVRAVGLYPYLGNHLSWDEMFLCEAYSADVGQRKVVLHREQASVLKRLLEGDNIALSAPTSFGKSFVIDAYISIKKPKDVLIIVPTIALADELRRRLQSKFGYSRKIVTATEDPPSDAGNIFVFPQERAISYADRMPMLDLLIVDEFYKAGQSFDKDRAGALIRAIIKFSNRARQRYFLAPNISSLSDNQFTAGMEFIRVDFNTVFLEKHEYYKEIKGSASMKSDRLVDIVKSARGKTLVYVGTYSGIAEVSGILLESLPKSSSEILDSFRSWLIASYGSSWLLPRLVSRNVGIHNGQLHRSLSQIQIKLFEEEAGLNTLISTSSIIEGVNTSAQNVVLWKNKNGKFKLSDFDYKNIIGRGGRMLKHFVGHIYILEEPPQDSLVQLDIELPDSLLGLPDIQADVEMSSEQRKKADKYNSDISSLLDGASLDELLKGAHLQTNDSLVIKKIVEEIRMNPNNWAGLSYLNSGNPDDWEWTLYKILELSPGGWDAPYRKFVSFVKVLSRNWALSIPEMLDKLSDVDIDLDLFFKLERNVSFKLATLVGDLNTMLSAIKDNRVDVSSFVVKASHAFLPPVVFELEEYGLPRMLSRKIHRAGMINFDDSELVLGSAVRELIANSEQILGGKNIDLHPFEKYIFDYFLLGVSSEAH